jgi:NACHT domain
MTKARKKTASKTKLEKQAPARIEDPDWLSSDPVGSPPPPVTPRQSALPYLELGWENFERLCRRLAQANGAVEKAWSYGTSGYGQLGIDILVRMKDQRFEAWQSKRHKTFGVAALKEAVRVFVKARWAKQAKRFVLAVACTINDPKVIDEIENTRTQLGRRGIAFEPLFASDLTERLKTQPEIIDDFFGRAWVENICSPEAVAVLADRMSRLDVASLRTRLRALYAAWIGIVDPGLPLVGLGAGDVPAPELSQRYVVPDVILELGVAERERLSAEPEESPVAKPSNEEAALYPAGTEGRPTRTVLRTQPSERRIPLGQFLAEAARAVIIADAGAGKTTLLRYLALDILSDAPAVAERYADYVPVWVPFALWARMCEGRDRPPPLEDVVQGFIKALNEAELAERMRRVLRTGRFVLLVDGLDETREPSIADALIVSLTVFAEQAGVSVLATTRPHGTKALSGIGGTWRRARLAPLSEQQRGILHFYGIAFSNVTSLERPRRWQCWNGKPKAVPKASPTRCWAVQASRGLHKRRSFSCHCLSCTG